MCVPSRRVHSLAPRKVLSDLRNEGSQDSVLTPRSDRDGAAEASGGWGRKGEDWESK